MYIVTLEIGYSRHLSRNAKLNGAKLEEFDIQYYDPDNNGIVDTLEYGMFQVIQMGNSLIRQHQKIHRGIHYQIAYM